MSTFTADLNLRPKGYQQIADVSSAVGLTVPTEANGSKAHYALIQAVTKNVRWRDDGTDPTAAVGVQLAAGDDFWYTGDLSAIKFIEEAASAEVNVAYYAAK